MDLPAPAAPFALELTGVLFMTVTFTPEPGAWPADWTAEGVRAATVELYRNEPALLLDLATPKVVLVAARVVE